MADYFISVNKFSIKVSHKNQYVNMNSFNNTDIIEKIGKTLKTYKNDIEKYESATANDKVIIKDEIKLNKVIECREVLKNARKDYKYLFCNVMAGENGIIQDVYEEDNDDPIFKIKKEHIPMSHFYIFVAFPYGNYNNGIIIFQGIGKYGVKSSATRYLKKCLKKIDNDYVLQVNTISSLDHIKKIISGNEITKFSMTKNYKSINNRDPLVKKEQRILYSPKFKNFKNLITNMANTGKFEGSGVSIIDEFKPDECSVTMDYCGKAKTIGLNNISTVGIVEYVSDMINVDQNTGLPSQKSILSIFKNAFDDYKGFLD